MKKFLTCLCTSTLPLKGIYTVLFIFILTLPVFSQVEQTDKTPTATPFHKWEVGFDLKPLFRSDEPYNVLGKWHFTERKAVRVGLGTISNISSSDSVKLFNQDFNRTTSKDVLFYKESFPKQSKTISGQFSIGYQYSIINNMKIRFYTATDLSYKQLQEDFNNFGGAELYGNTNLFDTLKSNIYYNRTGLIYLKNRVKTLGASQIIGFSYKVNPYLSISSEFSVAFFRTNYFFSKEERLASNSSSVLYTGSEFKSSGTYNEVLLRPLLGLYLNYHF